MVPHNMKQNITIKNDVDLCKFPHTFSRKKIKLQKSLQDDL